jgi:hypothetical protein
MSLGVEEQHALFSRWVDGEITTAGLFKGYKDCSGPGGCRASGDDSTRTAWTESRQNVPWGISRARSRPDPRRCATATRSARTAKKPAKKTATTTKTTFKKSASGKLMVATRRRPARPGRPKVSAARLRELIEEAIVDAYNEDEQRMGFLTMIQEQLDVPFETEVLGVPVQVTDVDLSDAEEIVAVCKRGAHVQRIPVVDLPLPQPPPEGFEWIEAYRFYQRGGG